MNIFLDYIIFILIILFTHLITYNTQAISGSSYFYGVCVNQIKLEKQEKDNIDRNFKKNLNLSLILVIFIYILLKYTLTLNTGINMVVSITIYSCLYYLLLKKEYKKVKEIKDNYLRNNIEIKDFAKMKKYIKEDDILVKEKNKIKNKFKVLFTICIGLSILSFLYVLVSYKNMPDIIITHWGSGGIPDGFAKKNIVDAFFTNFIDIGMVILFALMGIGSISSKTYIDAENLEVNRKKAIKYLNGIGYSFFIMTLIMQSITSLIPVFMVQQKNIPIQLIMFSCIAPIFIVVPLIYFYIMLSSLKPKDKSIYTVESDDEKWIYGFVYYNKDDSSLMVEKRFGAGWSINMAHPMGKFITIIIFVTIVGSIVICFI